MSSSKHAPHDEPSATHACEVTFFASGDAEREAPLAETVDVCAGQAQTDYYSERNLARELACEAQSCAVSCGDSSMSACSTNAGGGGEQEQPWLPDSRCGMSADSVESVVDAGEFNLGAGGLTAGQSEESSGATTACPSEPCAGNFDALFDSITNCDAEDAARAGGGVFEAGAKEQPRGECGDAECTTMRQLESGCERPRDNMSAAVRPRGSCSNRVEVDETRFVMDEPRRPLIAALSTPGVSHTVTTSKSGLPKFVRPGLGEKNSKPARAASSANGPPRAKRPAPGRVNRALDDELDFGLGPVEQPLPESAKAEPKAGTSPRPSASGSLHELKASVGKFGRNLKGFLRTFGDRGGTSTSPPR